MATAIVVDTMIASAWLGLRYSQRKARCQPPRLARLTQDR